MHFSVIFQDLKAWHKPSANPSVFSEQGGPVTGNGRLVIKYVTCQLPKSDRSRTLRMSAPSLLLVLVRNWWRWSRLRWIIWGRV